MYVMLAMILATACDDKNESNYEPGQPTAEGSMGVYFDDSNPRSLSSNQGRQLRLKSVCHDLTALRPVPTCLLW